jgi:hypothetical protein
MSFQSCLHSYYVASEQWLVTHLLIYNNNKSHFGPRNSEFLQCDIESHYIYLDFHVLQDIEYKLKLVTCCKGKKSPRVVYLYQQRALTSYIYSRTLPQVSKQAIAWLASCKNTVMSLKGVSRKVLHSCKHHNKKYLHNKISCTLTETPTL